LTAETPTLSEADPQTETRPETVLPGAGAENETDGRVVSGGGGGGGGGGGVGELLNVTVSVVTTLLPKLSVAWAAIVCAPSGYEAVLREKLHELVPDADWNTPPSMLTLTFVSEAPVSEAEPETATAPDTVEPDEGEAIEMVGFEEVFAGLPPLPPAAALGAKTRRKQSASAAGTWQDRCWARRESMRGSL
jgi:hypothetical protein